MASKSPIMLALTNPVPGREAEFNRWYDEIHARELVAVPGIAAAQRYVIVPAGGASAPYQYLTSYEIEGSVESLQQNLAATRESRSGSDAVAAGGAMWTYKPIGPRITG